MTIYNYSTVDAAIIFEAAPFAVKAGDSIEVDSRVAEYWLNIHGFLSTEKAPEASAPEKKTVAPKAKKEEKKSTK